jgi:uncharacterized protein GlcG (DUF336 family)
MPRRMMGAATLALALALAPMPGHAEDVLVTHRLAAALANEAVGAAVAACAKQGYAVTAVLVDSDGVRQAELRGDNAGIHTLGSAHDKAYTSISFKADTGAIVERTNNGPVFAGFNRLEHLLLAQGGVVIKLGEEPIGAIGVGGAPGGDKDEACAKAGIEQIAGRLK